MSAIPSTPVILDPGPKVRTLVALLLRVGLGLTMLKRGVVDYLSLTSSISPGFFMSRVPIPIDLEPYFHYLAYAEMALGLALILGFFTTAAAVLAGCLQLITPLLQTVVTLSTQFVQARGMNVSVVLSLYEGSGASNLLVVAAVLWFSPVASNPWSLDRLIFVPRERPATPAPASAAPADAPAPVKGPAEPPSNTPAPGSRAREFIANRAE
jgi:uncharacterized membrane protein YphA (DoxX/SURF4 family)